MKEKCEEVKHIMSAESNSFKFPQNILFSLMYPRGSQRKSTQHFKGSMLGLSR